VKFLAAVLFFFCVTLLFATAPVQAQNAKDVVAPSAYPSYDPVSRGMSMQIAVVLKIRPGFHVNAREVSAEYLIRTDLRADAPAGFKTDEIVYPKGTLQSFNFSKDKKLNVYTDTVTLYLPISVLLDAPLGPQHVPLKLRYQACSTEICLPPVTLNLQADLNVTANRSSAQSAHQELFPQKH
jgi:Disulphide bond corrector protein DsbC